MRKAYDTDNHSTCSTANQRTQSKRGLARFSLRRLLYSSPLVARRVARNTSGTSKSTRKEASRENEVHWSGPFRDPERDVSRPIGGGGVAVQYEDMVRVTSKASFLGSSAGKSGEVTVAECPLCLAELPIEYFPELSTCGHRSCYDCFQQYLRIEISESRVCIACPECSEPMHPNDIRMILNDKTQFEKYEDFMVRRVLATDPDTRWCPAPDCGFAVIAAGCASCPKIKCERPGCDAFFCYHCKAEWHPNQTCDAARAQRSPNVRSSSVSFSQDSQHRDDIKPCPRCQVLIVKMDDGSCNHMTCAVCGAEFCWLCMKEISDLHYLSPSGCTFWGKKPWSRKKKILWQLGTLVGAPVGIGLVAGIAVPAMIIGIPVWVGRKLYARYEHTNKHKRNLAIAGGVTASVLVSPVLAGLAVGIGVPILLFYVYGVVPVSLCRSGGCGVSTSGTGVRFDFDDENDLMVGLSARNTDAASMDAVSHRGANPSIGEVSLSLGSGSQLERLGRESDRESASNVALAGASLAGSIASSLLPGGQRLEVQADVSSTQRFSMSSETASAATSLSEKSASASIADDGAASTRALAGSVLNFKVTPNTSLLGYRGVSTEAYTPVEVHIDATSQRSDEVPAPDSFNSLQDSSADELPSGLKRGGRKRMTADKETAEGGVWSSGGEDGNSERVHFDNHISFIQGHTHDSQTGAQSERYGVWGWSECPERGHDSRQSTPFIDEVREELEEEACSGRKNSSGAVGLGDIKINMNCVAHLPNAKDDYNTREDIGEKRTESSNAGDFSVQVEQSACAPQISKGKSFGSPGFAKRNLDRDGAKSDFGVPNGADFHSFSHPLERKNSEDKVEFANEATRPVNVSSPSRSGTLNSKPDGDGRTILGAAAEGRKETPELNSGLNAPSHVALVTIPNDASGWTKHERSRMVGVKLMRDRPLCLDEANSELGRSTHVAAPIPLPVIEEPEISTGQSVRLCDVYNEPILIQIASEPSPCLRDRTVF